MKPSFALDFRDGLVTLLHRTSRGWSQVGSTAFDAPDFAEALGYMRSTALGLSPRGITTKLIIPNDQILYTGVHAPGPDAAKRKRQIKAGLEGRTPYPVDDLVYDWWGTGPDLNVAVIAKETLAEAEAFATEHRFNPVSFVGVPDNGVFLGEPFFGPSALAATILSDGEKVERDSEPVSIIARDFHRGEAKAKTAADAAATGSEAALPDPVDLPAEAGGEEIDAAPAVEVDAAKPENLGADIGAEPAAEPATDSETADATVGQTFSEAPAPAEDLPPEPVRHGRVAANLPAAEQTQSAKEPVAARAEPESTFAPVPPAQRPPRSQPSKAFTPSEAPEAPMAVDVADSPSNLPDDVPPSPAAEIVAAFANRRSAAIAAATGGSASGGSASGGSASAMGASAPVGSKQGTAAAAKIPAVGPAPVQRPTVARPNVARPVPASPRDTVPFPIKTNGAAVKAPAGKPAKPGGAAVTAAGIVGARRDRNVVTLPTSGTPEEQAAAAARRAAAKPPTGLGSRAVPIKGKPRYLGLILTVLLLVLLVAVAAWSSFFMGANDTTGTGAGTPATTSPAASLPEAEPATKLATGTTPETATGTAPDTATQNTTVTAEATPDAAPAAEPDPAATAAAEAAKPSEPQTVTEAATDTAASTATQTPAAQPAETSTAVATASAPDGQNTTTPATASAAPTTTTAAVTPPQPAPAPVAEPAPKTEVSTMGAVAVTPSTAVEGKITVAMADTPPKPVGPLALPAVATGADAGPAPEPPPPPYGTVYKFDAEGRIIPTPEGIITPEGVLLIAGKPKLAPPQRPAELTPVVPQISASPATLPTPPASDPATSAAGIANAIDLATGAATADDTALPAVAPSLPASPEPLAQDPTLADKRPKDKPANLAPVTDQQGAVVVTAEDTRLASLHPAARPKDLPQSPLAPDTGADALAASASLAANGFALKTSLNPPARPSGLDKAVDTAVEAALKQPEPEKQPAPETQVASNAPAPDVQDEPEVEAPAPNMPTNASVAKQATTKRAINTNRIALLAVFGTPSTRFAMVRQGNGAVKKIKVGDTVDGGRVAAITANSVQYQKGGRIVTLSLPTG